MSKAKSARVSAVITGDIVRSTQLNSRAFEDAQSNLEDALDTICSITAGHYEKFRGDSFQLYLPKGSQALTFATIIRLAMYYRSPHVEVRQSIGVGINAKISSDLRIARGKIFELSGHGLDKMKNQRLALHFETKEPTKCATLLVRHLDTLLSCLSKEQALVLHAFLLHDQATHQQIADSVDKSRVNTTQILNASHYRLVQDTLVFVRELIDGIEYE